MKQLCTLLFVVTLLLTSCSLNDIPLSQPPTEPPTINDTTENEPTEETPDYTTATNYLHISFDDVTICFQKLSTRTYPSLFDEPFFAKLKDLHEEYGVVFSLYTYNTTLAQTPDIYAEEFSANAYWLKIGFHSNAQGYSLANESYENGKTYWNTFVTETLRICGNQNSLDRMPRLEYFSGSEQALLGMRDADCGALGFLSADDSRLSYYFNENEATYLYDYDHWQDKENGLLFISTDIRGDWWFNFSTQNEYKKPTYNTAYEELSYRFQNEDFINSSQSLIVFTHEWLVYDGATINDKFSVITDTCAFAEENSILFAYPQNVFYDSE